MAQQRDVISTTALYTQNDTFYVMCTLLQGKKSLKSRATEIKLS